MCSQPLNYNDDSGINSLRGFAYQIRVFIYYMSKMVQNSQVEFETLDDIVVNNVYDTKRIESNSESFSSMFKKHDETEVIQVKRTKINNSTKDKLLFNWLILHSQNEKICKYVLYTEEEYANKNDIFNSSHDKLYGKIVSSDKKANALISIVKEIYNGKPTAFEEAYKNIENKFKFISEKNIDELILDGFAIHFGRGGISNTYYMLRIKELLNNITGEILAAVNERKTYVCTYEQLAQKVEDIRDRIKENHFEPDFSSFKKVRKINMTDINILGSREYTQLLKCKLPEKRIEEHLIYQQYYESIRDRSLEDLKISYIENIEYTTYENYCSVKEDLEDEGNDSPVKRLHKTKNMPNSYVKRDQTRYGSCIYLTKDNIEDTIKISWEDE